MNLVVLIGVLFSFNPTDFYITQWEFSSAGALEKLKELLEYASDW